ncbi:unnamed protein product [Mytilus edulis]|uniref:Uncharacterized protein n=1 Tax=Mytilus edulis TaxID=6550 RepID=A0A8S3U4N8_MYTED|nr:unnamed protein product [Mytilus edulis]
MARCKLSVAELWQAIGMSNAGRSTRSIGNYFNVNHTVIVRLLQRHVDTGTVNDRPRSGRPRLTTRCDERLLIRRAKAITFTPATKHRNHWPPDFMSKEEQEGTLVSQQKGATPVVRGLGEELTKLSDQQFDNLLKTGSYKCYWNRVFLTGKFSVGKTTLAKILVGTKLQ